MALPTTECKNETRGKNRFLPAIFLLVAVVGLFYVKWNPYFTKALLAASKHSIGSSILTGKAAVVPEPSFNAALDYALSYFKAVWKAVVLGLLLGSLVQVLIPREWIQKALGGAGVGSTIKAGAMALPGMMCTCCAAPVAVGLKNRSASTNAALAFFLANPVLNPATIIFMGFVLSWKFAIFRAVIGLLLVFIIATFASRFDDKVQVTGSTKLPIEEEVDEQTSLFSRWMKALWQLIIDTIPAYLIVVALLGAFRAWLFPMVGSDLANGLLAVVVLAITGTLFVVPTAAEIPIVQTLMASGLGVGPAAVLLITLPAVSLTSLLLIKRAFSTKVLMFVGCSVAVIGALAGLIAPLVL